MRIPADAPALPTCPWDHGMGLEAGGQDCGLREGLAKGNANTWGLDDPRAGASVGKSQPSALPRQHSTSDAQMLLELEVRKDLPVVPLLQPTLSSHQQTGLPVPFPPNFPLQDPPVAEAGPEAGVWQDWGCSQPSRKTRSHPRGAAMQREGEENTTGTRQG